VARPGCGNALEKPYTNQVIEIPLSEAQFAAAAQRLRPHGVELTAPTGTISRSGVTARYTYTGSLLTIEIIQRPFLVPVSVIESKLKAYIEQALAEPANPPANTAV
jgi:hypothetical protein